MITIHINKGKWRPFAGANSRSVHRQNLLSVSSDHARADLDFQRIKHNWRPQNQVSARAVG
ncbi:MAG: hypothetical protein BVN35_19125 [Proteobacteria bacterium ST_bin11]|nr:MAG: hypothetical protein BVN35_19125 [Proteobacteria bacterium ST_bin11]